MFSYLVTYDTGVDGAAEVGAKWVAAGTFLGLVVRLMDQGSIGLKF